MNLFGDHLGPRASASLADPASLSTSAHDGPQVWDLGWSGEEIRCTREAPK